jgi:hypothetical protein
MLADALHRLRSRPAPGIREPTTPAHPSCCETGSDMAAVVKSRVG